MSFELVRMTGAAIYGASLMTSTWIIAQASDKLLDNIERVGTGIVVLAAGALIFRWLIVVSNQLMEKTNAYSEKIIAENARLRLLLKDRDETIEVLANGRERRDDTGEIVS